MCARRSIDSTQASAALVVGGSTTFITDPGIASVYNSLNVSATLIPPASGDVQDQPQTLILPITGGDTTTEIDHAGGVILQALGQTLDVSNIVIHISGVDANKVTADLTLQGKTANLPVADISGSNSLIIDPAFAALIVGANGPDLTGTTLATFNSQPQLAATAAPEPGPTALITGGLLAFAAIKLTARRDRKREAQQT